MSISIVGHNISESSNQFSELQLAFKIKCNGTSRNVSHKVLSHENFVQVFICTSICDCLQNGVVSMVGGGEREGGRRERREEGEKITGEKD